MKKLLLLCSLCLCSLTSLSQTTVQGHKDGFNCVVAVSTATGLTAGCSAIAGNRAMYITDIEFGSSAAAATFTADTFPTLKYGTGSTCGTGTTVFWQAMIGATGQVTSNLVTPIKIPKGNDVCWIMSTAGSKTLQIHGFYGDTE
jgi:hypothetical protein